MKRKLASVLVSLAFGWVATTAIAEDEKTENSESPAGMSEPAAVTDEATDTATIDSSTNDGTISATPAEADADKK